MVDRAVADVVVDRDIVRRLLGQQFPHLSGLPLQIIDCGWDNVIVRIGTDIAARVPRRRIAVAGVQREQAVMDAVGCHLPLPVPLVLHRGVPTDFYPHPWSIVPWLPGQPAVEATVDGSAAARALGTFLAVLHQPAPADAPGNPFRGVSLSRRRVEVEDRLHQLSTAGVLSSGDVADLTVILRRAVAAPAWSGPPVWTHGDLHPRNVLVVDGLVSAVIDFGDAHAGDPAVDAVCAWMLLPPDQHVVFRHRAPSMDDHTWTRGRGWAITICSSILTEAADDTSLVTAARTTLGRLLT